MVFFKGLSQGIQAGLQQGSQIRNQKERLSQGDRELDLAERTKTKELDLAQQNIDQKSNALSLSEQELKNKAYMDLLKQNLLEVQMNNEIRKNKFLMQKEQVNQDKMQFDKNLNLGLKYFDLGKSNIKDPTALKLYNENITSTEIFKTASPMLKSFFESISTMPIEQSSEFTKLANQYMNARQSGNIQDMQALSILSNIKAAETGNPSIERMAKLMSEESNINQPDTQLGKLLKERQALTNEQDKQLYDTKIKKEINPNPSIKSFYDPTTGNIIYQEESGLTNSTITNLEKDILSNQKRLMRLNEMKTSFDSNILNLENFAKSFGYNFAEKVFKIQLNQNQKIVLQKESKLMQATVNELNNYILEMSGKALTREESKRLSSVLPNMGKNIYEILFTSDGPTKFKAKLDNVINQVKKSIQRQNLIYKHGIIDSNRNDIEFFSPSRKKIGLNDMDILIDEIGDKYFNDIKTKNPTLSDDEIDEIVLQKLQEDMNG